MSFAFLAALGATLVVRPAGPIRTLTDALALARPGDSIVVHAGTYREPPIVVRTRVTIVGVGGPVFVGGEHSTLEVEADSVVITGLRFRQVTPSPLEDRAAIVLRGTRGCRIEANDIRDAFFGIYALKASDCLIRRNRIEGSAANDAAAGNGIQLWQARAMSVVENEVLGHRDGIYLEFSPSAVVRGNRSSGNRRYGLHFMRSDSCTYAGNLFARNGAGVAVMYSRNVQMLDNRFERNWGDAAYGLLLKEISDGTVTGNLFADNTVGLYLEDANRNILTGNTFQRNGWAVKVLASATDNRFEGNVFEGNSFDVSTNSRSASSRFAGNWWDQYRGYDLDRDGVGDVPYRPVRLFSLVVERHEPSLILLRSPFVELLDAAERFMPVLTPETLVDGRPLMRRPR
ncbi:MAG: nitrous oxide reductase family maturation protein NosD [Gemmatimonadales bacterium]|nr:nitrous oxide reductase family maturation protein NosD [Gemmatimonadales bacterium]